MNNNFSNLIIITLLIVVIVGSIIFYQQQKSIIHPEQEFSSSNQDNKNTTGTSKNISDIKNDTKNTLFINGKITDISDNYITVDATLIDIDKLDELDFSQSIELPTKIKKYIILIDNDTNILINGIANSQKVGTESLRVGISIEASADILVYEINKFTAKTIVVPPEDF